MGTKTPGPNGPLWSQCTQYSDYYPNKRPLDQLWDQYARNPELAYQKFREHIPEYTHGLTLSRNIGVVPGRLHVAAAFGGALVASEAGSMNAEAKYRRMRPDMRKVGDMVLQVVSHSVSEAYITDAGSALGVYMAASAMDQPEFTEWTASARPTLMDFHEGQSSGIRKSNTFTPVETMGYRYLQARYRGKTMEHLPLLALAYAEVVRMTGSLPKFFQQPGDRISAQHVEDFVSTCLRLAYVPSLRQPNAIEVAQTRVANKINSEHAGMFCVGALLLRNRGIPVKGHLNGRYMRFGH